MENEFDQGDFENYLTENFFDCNEQSEIASLIKEKLAEDEQFKEQYELWIEETGYDNWKEFYIELKGQEDMVWEQWFPDGDDDDSITDFLTRD